MVDGLGLGCRMPVRQSHLVIQKDGRLKPYSLQTLFTWSTDEWIGQQAATYLLCMTHTMSWYTNFHYKGHTLTEDENEWRLIVKAEHGGKRYVTFANGATPGAAVRHFAISLASGMTQWYQDRFAE